MGHDRHPIRALESFHYVEGVKSACCMLHAMLPGCTKYSVLKESKEIKNTHNTLDLRYLSLMSKESKVHLIYIVLQLYFSC